MRAHLATKIAFVTALPATLTACPGSRNLADVAQLPNGFTCPVVPTDLSPPGTIYRVTPQGVVFTVYVPNPQTPLRTSSSFSNITSSEHKDVQASVVARLLKLNIGANASVNTTYAIIQNYKGVTFSDTSDPDMQAIINKAKQNYTRVSGNKYYIVREVMSVTGIDYEFDRDISDSFGADVPVKVVQVDPKASYTNTGKFAYNETFNPAVFACSKSEEITM